MIRQTRACQLKKHTLISMQKGTSKNLNWASIDSFLKYTVSDNITAAKGFHTNLMQLLVKSNAGYTNKHALAKLGIFFV